MRAAAMDKKLEPKANEERMAHKFFQLMDRGLFFPSFGVMQYFGRGRGRLIDLPLERLGPEGMARTSVSDSSVFGMLDGEDPYLVDVPGSFLRILDAKRTWRFQYADGTGSGELPATQLWEALSKQMVASGIPILHFPEALRPEAQLNNPPGPMVRGALNLSRFVKFRDGMSYFDWNLLVETVVQAIRFLDALVELVEEQRQDGYMASVRRVGLGVIGWGEALARLGIAYDSSEALNEGRRVAKFIHAAMQEASAGLANYRPAVEGASVRIRGFEEKVRNLCRFYVLPEEELAFIAGTTPGIEPLPGLAGRYVNYLEGESPLEINKALMEELERRGLVTEAIMDQLLDEGRLEEDSGLDLDLLRVFRVRGQIDPSKVVEQQTTFQQYADDIVAVRVALPEDASQELVDKCFRLALRLRGRIFWVEPAAARRKGRYFQQGTASNR